jgi:hypothetical protein
MANGAPLPMRPINPPAATVGIGAPAAVRVLPAERARSAAFVESCTSPVVLNTIVSPLRTRIPVDTQPAFAGMRIAPGLETP